MWTKTRDDVWEDHWVITNPFGINVCTVTTEDGADLLLYLLNCE